LDYKHEGDSLDDYGKPFTTQDFFDFPQEGKRKMSEERHPCPKCARGFPHGHQLVQHLYRHDHPQSTHQPWFCDWCQGRLKFDSVTNLVYHKMIDHPDRAGQCKRCRGIVYLEDPGDVRIHSNCKKWHQCVCCGAKIKAISHFEKHLKDRGEAHARVPYQCPLCPGGVEFATFLDHKRHCNESHQGLMVQPCFFCDEVFGSKRMKLDHMRVDHSEEGVSLNFPRHSDRDLFKEFQCSKCCLGFVSAKSLEAHDVRHNCNDAEGVDSWSCNICDRPFSSRVELKAHNDEHHADVPVTCHICHAKFPSRQLGRLRTHIRKIHEAPPKPREESSVCVCCGLIFEKRKMYTEHIRVQGEYHNNKCPQCPGLSFQTWPEHEEHVKKLHDGHFVSRCKHCPEYFHSGLLARKHMREVHPSKKVTANIPREMCVECGKLMLKTNMKEHMDREHGTTEFPCDECPKICYSKWQLKKHKSHHDKTYPCPHCGKNMTKEWLKKHIMVNHTPDHLKPLQCTVCPKGFAFSKDLKAHMNTHTGEKPYKCDICNAAFAHPANHRAHMRAHRGIKRKK